VEGKKLKITPIKNGIVIDHIKAGQVLNVCKILGISPGTEKVISIAMNVESKKMGKKDILKIEGRQLETSEIHRVAIISPNATINRIEDFVVVQKEKVHLPSLIEGIIKCSKESCISNDPGEPIRSKFIRQENGDDFTFQCYYCGQKIGSEKIMESII